MKAKSKKPKLLDRRMLGIRVVEGRVTLAQAYLVYEENYDDGSKKIVHGHRIFGASDAGTRAGLIKGQARPDLFWVIQACADLHQLLEAACSAVDDKVMKKPPRW